MEGSSSTAGGDNNYLQAVSAKEETAIDIPTILPSAGEKNTISAICEKIAALNDSKENNKQKAWEEGREREETNGSEEEKELSAVDRKTMARALRMLKEHKEKTKRTDRLHRMFLTCMVVFLVLNVFYAFALPTFWETGLWHSSHAVSADHLSGAYYSENEDPTNPDELRLFVSEGDLPARIFSLCNAYHFQMKGNRAVKVWWPYTEEGDKCENVLGSIPSSLNLSVENVLRSPCIKVEGLRMEEASHLGSSYLDPQPSSLLTSGFFPFTYFTNESSRAHYAFYRRGMSLQQFNATFFDTCLSKVVEKLNSRESSGIALISGAVDDRNAHTEGADPRNTVAVVVDVMALGNPFLYLTPCRCPQSSGASFISRSLAKLFIRAAKDSSASVLFSEHMKLVIYSAAELEPHRYSELVQYANLTQVVNSLQVLRNKSGPFSLLPEVQLSPYHFEKERACGPHLGRIFLSFRTESFDIPSLLYNRQAFSMDQCLRIETVSSERAGLLTEQALHEEGGGVVESGGISCLQTQADELQSMASSSKASFSLTRSPLFSLMLPISSLTPFLEKVSSKLGGDSRVGIASELETHFHMFGNNSRLDQLSASCADPFHLCEPFLSPRAKLNVNSAMKSVVCTFDSLLTNPLSVHDPILPILERHISKVLLGESASSEESGRYNPLQASLLEEDTLSVFLRRDFIKIAILRDPYLRIASLFKALFEENKESAAEFLAQHSRKDSFGSFLPVPTSTFTSFVETLYDRQWIDVPDFLASQVETCGLDKIPYDLVLLVDPHQQPDPLKPPSASSSLSLADALEWIFDFMQKTTQEYDPAVERRWALVAESYRSSSSSGGKGRTLPGPSAQELILLFDTVSHVKVHSMYWADLNALQEHGISVNTFPHVQQDPNQSENSFSRTAGGSNSNITTFHYND